MHKIEFVFALSLFQLVCNVDGVGECRSTWHRTKFTESARKLFCYDCDSRQDPYCDDPFNRTLPPELEPHFKICHGCCVKFVHKYPRGEWVERSCTENLIINYFMVDKVCMGEGRGHGKMCFCENNYCNDAPLIIQSYLLPTVCFLCGTIFQHRLF